MTRARRTLVIAGTALAVIGASAAVQSDPGRRLECLGERADRVLYRDADQRPEARRPRRRARAGGAGKVADRQRPSRTDTPLLKHAVALPGAEVCRHGNTVLIDGRAAAEARERAASAVHCRSGGVAACSARAECFSLTRMRRRALTGATFGPLHADTIIGRATPLWTWQG